MSSNRKGLSDRIMNMKFMKNEILNESENNCEDDNNWQTSFTLGDVIDTKITPLVSVYNKPQSLIKKIYEVARRSSQKNKIIQQEQKIVEQDVDSGTFRRKNRKNRKNNKK